MATFLDYRKATEQAMYHLLSRALEEKRIDQQNAEAVKHYIQQNIDKLNTHAQIVHFLQTASQQSPIFSPLLQAEKAKAVRTKQEVKRQKQANALAYLPKVNIKELEKSVLNIIITALEEKKMTEEESQRAAQYILSQIDELYDQEDVIVFVKKLSAEWPVFNTLVEIEEGKISRQKENIAADEMAALIKSGHASQATTMAQQVIQG